MRKYLILIGLLIALQAQSQSYLSPQGIYGVQFNRLKILSTLFIPTLADTATHVATDSLYSLKFATQDKSLRYWNGTRWAVSSVSISGAAGGALSGNYPNPVIGSGVIVGDNIAPGTIAYSNLNLAGSVVPTDIAPTAFGTYGSTIGGFSGTPTQSVKWILYGKTLIVKFNISGNSSTAVANSFTFTIPYNALDQQNGGCIRLKDNSAFIQGYGMFDIQAGSNVVTIYKDGLFTTTWSPGGVKAANGEFIIETQ